MNAVLRLNLIVVIVFAIALVVTLNEMIEQATKDIKREVISGLSFTHQLLSVAAENESLLESLLEGETRHVHIEIVGSNSQSAAFSSEPENEDEESAPDWFQDMIPGLDKLQEKKYYRYLPDGRALLLQADPSDEVGEVWESIQHILMLFGLSVLLSNIAIYIGVKQGIKPVTDFLTALREIEKGRYTARLNEYSIKEINELSSHFNAMAHALEESQSDNARLTHELMRIQENERAHLARELHDDLGQYLTGIRAQAYLIKQSAHVPELVASVGNQIAINCDAMQTSFRQLIRELHPVILEQLGLLEAIRTQVENWGLVHTGIKVNLQLPEHIPDMDDERNTHIYRIVQEALNNVAQHSSADSVLIHLQVKDSFIYMNVTDNGVAVERTKTVGLGLRSMQERARCMQGELEFIQEQNKGSLVQLKVPVREEVV
ncbi:sensor histidine kinase [Neptuniibacter caesariensis]|uniref:Sensor histidine kinase n=1 Tax=Neptuniibacter caesariensis TaxID=207954 RepID=A0A7U8C960_NEPCE|nr:sensor histidine kinase [Neptuniibacter caesariensis]EAR62104.1 sensor histidine kinase [Oceanospirillum sp. MED92] [Neptuniibacter caesariensis]